jgi:hypothetical protein
MVILLTALAVLITSVPLAAVVLVTVACRHEETARSIAGLAPGPLARAGRRLLAFHAVGIRQPACRTRSRTRNRWIDDLADDDLADDDLTLAGSTPRR